jgi:hypothetical protein
MEARAETRERERGKEGACPGQRASGAIIFAREFRARVPGSVRALKNKYSRE